MQRESTVDNENSQNSLHSKNNSQYSGGYSKQRASILPSRRLSRGIRKHSHALIEQNEFQFSEASSNGSVNTEIHFSKHRSTLKGSKKIPTELRFFKD